MKRSYVWDLPVRVFHWVLVVLVCVSLYTGIDGGFKEMDWHMYSGYAILTLVVFRITWGFFGGHNARFATFIKGPGPIIDYVRNLRSSPPGVGHSPLAALSIVAILLALLVQAGTGLFANDDIFIEGPLAHLVSEDMSNDLTGVHEINQWIIIGLITLHLVAIAFYQLVRKDNLIVPMITGWKHGVEAPPEQNRLVVAAILIAVVAGLVYYLTEYL